MYIDGSLYPDLDEPPTELLSPYAKADYLHRVCAAWDFHIHPDQATFDLLSTWRDIFDAFPLPASPAYHAFRSWFGWPEGPSAPPELMPTPHYVHLDQLEGRPSDPCEGMI